MKINILNNTKYRLGSNLLYECGGELTATYYRADETNHPSYPSISLHVIHNTSLVSFN